MLSCWEWHNLTEKLYKINSNDDKRLNGRFLMGDYMAGGRPSKYRNEYVEQAYKLCLLGATDADLAGFFDVDEATINRWKVSHEEFCKSLKKGKYTADMEIAQSLHKRALGGVERLQKAFKVKHVKYKDGKRLSEDEEIIHDYDEVYIPPDTTAAIFWLKNRQPETWRDKREIEHSGKVGTYEAMSDDELNAEIAKREQT